MARIDVDNAGISFTVRQNSHLSLKEFLVRRMFSQRRNPLREVRALDGINLHLRDGDRLGVLGHNGAGKSTLLRLLAGIYPPTTGQCRVEGKICSLFDIALGFELDANGWENIEYRGYLQGETPKTIRAKRDRIAEFSELGPFLDMSLRYYSAGMRVRLAFSIATAAQPEVLLVDEVLSAGDLAFRVKAREKMHEMMASAALMVMVSHELRALENLCDQGIWMEQGRIRMAGPMPEVVAAYRAVHAQPGHKNFVGGKPDAA